MIPKTYRKLIAKQYSHDFRSATEIVEVSLQPPQADEIVIRNQFAGVNGGFDTLICQGKVPYVNPTPPFDLGVEVVGEVIAKGEKVTAFEIGDAVLTTARGGGYREYQTIKAEGGLKVPFASPEILTLMPTGVSALVALEQVGDMKNGEVVLVSGAAGGTGHIAVQLAKLAGNHVIGVCGTEEKSQFLQQLGCDRVINYRQENVNDVLKKEYPKGVNLVFECVGKGMFDTCVNNLAIRGRLVVVGFISEYAKDIEVISRPRIYHQLFWKAASVRGFLMPQYKEYMPEAWERLLHLLETNQIQVAIEPRKFRGIESIADAVEWLIGGKNQGKVVVRF